ncbi:Hypothetical protein SRAE_X000127100 [Strongyloides ratti]|uniref:Calycin-like domain and Calycin domain-containing protein n=1 Tax=Strongyloides ratti TaxID=34506 RepID=A0A090KQ66_STRRB|nr:Hypothetical protein SRAE_X000127100 [Strongyloides ratti]CEF59524.1 Hypothetical protein SRAE_X000127100 [Strongyloides ratti]
MKSYSIFLIFFCFVTSFITYTNAQDNQELVNFAQKVFNNVNNLTSILQEGKQTDISTLRRSISSILGGGLLGQIAENPIRLADHFGIDIDNFGFNRTILEQTIGIENLKNKENYETSKDVTTTPFPTTTTITTMPTTTNVKTGNSFDSVLLDDFGNVLPMTSFVQDNQNEIPKSAINIQVPSMPFTKPNVNFEPSSIPVSSTITAKIDEIQEIKEQLKKLEQLLILKEFTQKYPDLAEKLVSNNTPKTQQSIQYVPQNQQNIYKKSQSYLPQSTEPTITSSFIEINKPYPITRSESIPIQYKSKENLPQQSYNILNTQTSIQRPSRISLLQNQPRYAYKNNDNLEPIVSFNNDDNNIQKSSYPISDVKCECLEIEIDQLTGSWTKAMSSNIMITKFKKIVGKMFGLEGKMELTCSAFTIIPYENDDLSAKIQWIFRTPNSKRPFKINGVLNLTNDKRIAHVTFTDFNGFVTEIPLCILKNSDSTTSRKMNDYIVVVENNKCSEPVLMISNPQNFFDQVDHELIKYLKHMIQSGQFSTMDIVSSGETCAEM